MDPYADEPDAPSRGRLSRRTIALLVLAIAYVLLALAVVLPSPLLRVDALLSDLRLRFRYREIRDFVDYYMLLGQRGPATLVALPWFFWISHRERSTRPLVMLAAALVVLNVSVGVVKIATGRLGPRATGLAHDVFVGGNIFPSGHTSNTVVLYGLIAWIAVRHRTALVAATAFISITVGMGTIYLDTHWFSDVIGGWIAGALVLLILPSLMPTAQRWTDRLVERVRVRAARRRARAGSPRVPVASSGAASPAPEAVSPETVSPQPAGTTMERPPVRRVGAHRLHAPAPQSNATLVSSLARANSCAATPESRESLDEPTRRGAPRSSPIPSGP